MYALDLRSTSHAPAGHPRGRSPAKLSTRGWRDDLAVYRDGFYAWMVEHAATLNYTRDELLAFVDDHMSGLVRETEQMQRDLDVHMEMFPDGDDSGWLLAGQDQFLVEKIAQNISDIRILEEMRRDIESDPSLL